MTKIQKIRNSITILIFMIILTLSCVFYSQLNPLVVNMFATKFNVVSNKNNMLVHFINVNQSDAVAINLPDGKVMLIDTGSENVNTTYVNYLKENVLHTFKKDCIDYLVLSHADMDHVGGTIKLLKNFNVETIFMPKISSNAENYQEILTFVENNCDFKITGEEFFIEQNGYLIKFFEQLNNTNTNDTSQLIKVEFMENSFLFVGDISSTVEDEYIEKYGNELDCDVLKVAHHGSNSSTSNEFIEAVSPEYAVISVGAENTYGHPNFEVLTRLKNKNVKVLRTDKDDDVLFVVGKNYDLLQKNKTYFITSLTLNYVWLVIVSDCCLIILIINIIFKKEKNKHIT